MEITITSRETIKPLLPTPHEYRIFKLCLFDQLQLVTYLPTILFYRKTDDLPEPAHVCAQLKRSLSEALTIFYPFAGRRYDPTFITCNDEGTLYLEAKVNLDMVEFLKPPMLELLNKLLPCEPNKMHPNTGASLPQVLVQVNVFNCGGIAIGTCNLHTLLDGCTGTVFQTTWAAICRGSREEVPCPDFSSASSFFPPLNHLNLQHDGNNKESDIEKKCTTRRFVFDAETINNLRAKATSDDENWRAPTRYEALGAFIWKHMTLACKMESRDSTRPCVAIHIVDMRRRVGEPFNKHTVGNILWPVMVFCNTVNANTDIKYLISIAREEFGKLSRELFLRVGSDPNIIGSNQCVDLPQGIEKTSVIPIVLTSWSGMNINELDFGWGKPLWVGVKGGDQETLPNIAVIIETDAGMEAWVTMELQHIAILEKDVDFLRLALPNPNVSNI